MADYVEFYVACNPLLISRAVTEVITSARDRFEGSLLEILYEPDAQWFKCISNTASKSDICDYLQSRICYVHNERPELIDHGRSTLTSIYQPQADIWDLIPGGSETQTHFRDEDVYPASFAQATYKATWNGFDSANRCNIPTLFDHLCNVFGHEPLAHLETITGCTISRNLRQDNLYIKSERNDAIGGECVNFAKKVLNLLMESSDLFRQSPCGTKIYVHQVITTAGGSQGFHFEEVPKENTSQNVAYVITNTIWPLLMLQRVSLGEASRIVTKKVPGAALVGEPVKGERPDPFHYRFSCKPPDTIKLSSEVYDLSSENEIGSTHKVAQWLTRTSNKQMPLVHSLVPFAQDSPQQPTQSIPNLLDFDEDETMKSESPPDDMSLQRTARQLNPTIEKASLRLISMANIATLSPGDFVLSTSIGKCYFVDYFDTNTNHIFLSDGIAAILGGPRLAENGHFSAVLSTDAHDADIISGILSPGRNKKPDKVVQYEMRCKFHDGSEWITEIDADTFEYRIRRNVEEYSSMSLQCTESVWDARIAIAKCRPLADEHIRHAIRMAVKSLAVQINNAGDPVLEFRDLSCFSAKTLAVRLKYTMSYQCKQNSQLMTSISWYRRMKKKEGLIRHREQESAGLTWEWSVPETSTQPSSHLQEWLSVSITASPLNRLFSASGDPALVADSISELQKYGASGLIYDLCSVTVDIVGQLDQVGLNSGCVGKWQSVDQNDIW